MRGKETLLKLLPQTDKRERGLKAIYRQKALKHGSISGPSHARRRGSHKGCRRSRQCARFQWKFPEEGRTLLNTRCCGRGGFCFRLCGLASRPSSVETGQAIHSISMPGIPSPSPPLSLDRRGRAETSCRGERPTPILELSHPSVLTLRRPAGRRQEDRRC